MTARASRERIRADFDRIALLEEEDPRDPVERLAPELLSHLPRPCRRALDVGCGTGRFTRRLAARSDRTLGLDLSPRMIEIARARSISSGVVDYRVADVMTEDLPLQSFDAVTAIAMLHHVSIEAGLERLASLVAPGGVLIVVDLYDALDMSFLHLTGASWVLAKMDALSRRRPSRELRQAWREHGVYDVYPTIAQVRRAAASLPGVRIRPRLGWRWTLVWRRD